MAGKRRVDEDAAGDSLKKQRLAPFAWTIDYRQRAYLVSMKIMTREVLCHSGQTDTVFDDVSLPRMLTYHTLHPPKTSTSVSEYALDGIVTLKENQLYDLMQSVNINCKLTCRGTSWDMLIDHLKKCKFVKPTCQAKWQADDGSLNQFVSDNPTLSLMAVTLKKALLSDFNDGDAKEFISLLVTFIETEIAMLTPREKMYHKAPVIMSDTNGDVYYVAFDSSLDLMDPGSRPKSPASWEESQDNYLYAQPKRCRLVPDYIVYLPEYPGHFLLNFVCKKSTDDFSAAKIQCIKEVLTQMHFQETGVGIVISSCEWSLLLLHKADNVIAVREYRESLLESKGFDVSYTLNTKSLTSLCSWIYRIIDSRTRKTNPYEMSSAGGGRV